MLTWAVVSLVKTMIARDDTEKIDMGCIFLISMPLDALIVGMVVSGLTGWGC